MLTNSASSSFSSMTDEVDGTAARGPLGPAHDPERGAAVLVDPVPLVPVPVHRRTLGADRRARDAVSETVRGLDGGSMDASSQDVGPVVVGVDPSDCAREAADWAADLAAAWGAALHLVHVVPEQPVITEVLPWPGRGRPDARARELRGRGWFGDGSTSRALVEFAPCPVVVITPAAVTTEPSATARSAGLGR